MNIEYVKKIKVQCFFFNFYKVYKYCTMCMYSNLVSCPEYDTLLRFCKKKSHFRINTIIWRKTSEQTLWFLSLYLLFCF